MPNTTACIGYVVNYFDGAPMSWTSWQSGYPALPPPADPNKFSIMDYDNMMIILGIAVNVPSKVKRVTVWQ